MEKIKEKIMNEAEIWKQVEEFFVKNFAVKYILEFQKELLKDIKSSELSYILYLKFKYRAYR